MIFGFILAVILGAAVVETPHYHQCKKFEFPAPACNAEAKLQKLNGGKR